MPDPALYQGDARSVRGALLARIATRLVVEDRPDEIAAEVFAEVADHLDFDLLLHYLVAPDGSELVLNGCVGLPLDLAETITRVSFGQGICGKAAARRQSIVLEQVQVAGDPLADPIRPLGVRAYACHPLLGKRGVIGTLAFGSRTRDSFASDELELTQAVATLVAIVVERAQATALLERELAERRRVEDALRESQERLRRSEATFRSVFEQAAVGMGRVRFDDAQWVDVNDAFCRMLGYSRQEFLSTPWPSITHPDDVDLDLGPFRRMARGELDQYTVEKRFVHREGHLVWARLTLSLIRDAAGRPDYEIAIIEHITDRQRALQELRNERDFISAVLDIAASLVVVLDQAGRIVRFNRACEALTGYTEEEVEGRSYEMLVPEDERASLRKEVERLAAGDYSGEYENHWEARDGTRRLLAWCNTAITDASGGVKFIVATGVDITERRRVEEALLESQRLLRATMDNFPTVIAFKDRECRFMDVNGAVERALGLSKERIVGRSIRDFIPAEAADVLERHDRQVMESRRATQFEETTPLATGTIFHLNTNFPLIDSHGRVYGTGHISQDITARRRAEEALRAANTRLAEADRRKDEFIAILSHELRNPLAPIRFALPLLQQHDLPVAASRALGVVERQLSHLTRLVDDLLDASRITSGKIELQREQVTLGSVVTAASEAASPAILAARHTLTLDVPAEPIWLNADRGRLAQVVTNLLNNSARYTPRGGLITLSARRADEHAVISVRDTGIGIPAGSLNAVFDMFRQVGQADRSQGGLGIGLALAKQLVELHGGTIEARSDGPGRGSEFVVRLPLLRDQDDSGQARDRSLGCTATGQERRLRVLVVDDNTDLVDMLGTLVRGLGHEVRKALDGRSAVSAALSYRPDVILLDLGLPVMNGLEVARELRRSPQLAHTRLVALTGWGQADDRRQTERAGFDCHLTKPADPNAVAQMLAEFSKNVA